MSTISPTLHSRATGALYGLALGDALGMPTQMLSRPGSPPATDRS